MNLHIGEDGAALFDEEGRRVADIRLASLMTHGEWHLRDWETGKARRLALARQFAESSNTLDAFEQLYGWYNASHVHGGRREPCGECRQLEAAREALRKAGRL